MIMHKRHSVGPIPFPERPRCRIVARPVAFEGVGLHSGRPVRLVVRPAIGGGIRFRRIDAGGAIMPARFDAVVRTDLSTALGTITPDGRRIEVSTVEHLMAALAGLGIWHALIDIDGPEVPIMDGSALPFVRGLMAGGLIRMPRRLVPALRILAPVRVEDGAAWAELSPSSGPHAGPNAGPGAGTTLEVAAEIDFADPVIGRQACDVRLDEGSFLRELADARTFCRLEDVAAMQARGRALGGSVANALVIDGDRVLNPGGLRRPDEFVRHKALDAVGDLALAGSPIIGRYRGSRAGHATTNKLLRAVFADPAAWVVRA